MDIPVRLCFDRQDKEFGLDVVDLAKDPVAAGPSARSTTRNAKLDKAFVVGDHRGLRRFFSGSRWIAERSTTMSPGRFLISRPVNLSDDVDGQRPFLPICRAEDGLLRGCSACCVSDRLKHVSVVAELSITPDITGSCLSQGEGLLNGGVSRTY